MIKIEIKMEKKILQLHIDKETINKLVESIWFLPSNWTEKFSDGENQTTAIREHHDSL